MEGLNNVDFNLLFKMQELVLVMDKDMVIIDNNHGVIVRALTPLIATPNTSLWKGPTM